MAHKHMPNSARTNLRYPDENLRFTISTDADAWGEAWKLFPWEAGKWAAKMVNDQAFKFRSEVRKAIASRYTIRDERFISNAIVIQKAKPQSRMEDILSIVATNYGTSNYSQSESGRGWGGDGGVSTRFSGFTEELTGVSATNKHRVILPAGRKGGTMAGIAEDWARMKPGQYIPSVDRDVPGDVPEESRFTALVKGMAERRIKHSRANTFILKGPRYKKPGLYRFKGGALPRKGKSAWNLELEMIQLFKDTPVMPPQWDWQEIAEKKTAEKFTPDYIFENYIAKAILGILPEKKTPRPSGYQTYTWIDPRKVT
ncbi:MAG: hypothetical protein LBF74_03565 [Treponema sp.]|jgi:hypothetical protein|nr:hypothetical protein [Treponema sp.]